LPPTAPDGPLSRRSGRILTLGKMNIGGTNCPTALIQHTTVIVFPFSALVRAPSNFFPFLANIFPGL
jgi:hypothetical protein